MDEANWFVCSICSQEVDINHRDIEILSRTRGHTTIVRDKSTGLVHVLKERRSKRQKEIEDDNV
jgi:hypothetical protein